MTSAVDSDKLTSKANYKDWEEKFTITFMKVNSKITFTTDGEDLLIT